MIHALASYLPQDRRQALARGDSLPDRTSGAALFADISGFTPLTEALSQALGPRHSAEALTRQLDAVYTALIATVERYGGSAIGFAGDAITCWEVLIDESTVAALGTSVPFAAWRDNLVTHERFAVVAELPPAHFT